MDVGRYEIRSELGRGAMGIVYEAFDRDRQLEVALKVMSAPSGAASRESLDRQTERFFREARVLARCDHPRVVRFYEEGEANGRYFFAMERVSGTNLRDRLQFQGPLSLPEFIRLTLECCEALEHIHSRGIVHRDIKPDNIMFLPDGSAKLMDFGIARIVGEASPGSYSAFEGSPAYMSPEQVEGRDVDSRTDIYSLSVTLYEAATAQRAFLADSVPAVIQKVLKEYPLPPQGLPPYLMGVLLKAMAKDRDQRYPAAAQMAEDVRLGRSPFRRLAGAPTGAHAIPALRPRPPQPPAPATAARAPGSMPLAERPTGCIAHAGRRAVSACGRCMAPICHACLLELPGGAVLCRRCGFARGPVAAPAPGSRDW